MRYCYLIVFFFCLIGFQTAVWAQQEPHDAPKKSEGSISELIFHHVSDQHDWHIVDIPAGNGNYTPIAIHLPWIILNDGIDIFSLHGHSEAEIKEEAANKGYLYEHGHIKQTIDGKPVIDFSLTKTAIQILLICLLMTIIFVNVAGAYSRNAGKAPKGLQALLEPVIVFIRDEVAKPNLKEKYANFMPYLLTLFFFIWFSNMFGLTPFNSNIAGNISVTAALALLTFVITQFNGTAAYWGHIFWFPGVPLPVKFLMLPVELVGIFTKPFALMVRLFANIIAGHFMVLALVCLIFIFSKGGENILVGLGVAPVSIAFTLFIFCLETLVAAVQAYVFTLLTCVFIGSAMENHHHEDHVHH